MPTNTEIKANVDEFIIDPTSPQSVTRANVGGIIKSTVDYTDQEVAVLNTSKASVESVNAALATKASITYVDNAVDEALSSVYKFAGTWDASGGTFPTTGTGTAGAIVAGNVYRISVGGTMGGEVYSVNDQFVALIDDPGQTAANWDRFNYNEDEATTEQLGLVRYASDSEVNAGTGTGLPNVTQVQEMIDNSATSLGYTEYVAYITQSGTTGLSAAVRKNDTGKTISYNPTVSNAGRYAISVPGLDMTKTDIQLSPRSYSGKELEWDYYTSGTTITLRTKNRATEAFENDLLPGNILTIRIFP